MNASGKGALPVAYYYVRIHIQCHALDLAILYHLATYYIDNQNSIVYTKLNRSHVALSIAFSSIVLSQVLAEKHTFNGNNYLLPTGECKSWSHYPAAY